MKEKQPTKNKNDIIDEVVDMMIEGFEQVASDDKLRSLLERGDFSNKDFEWLLKWSSIEPKDRRAMDGSDRQHKLRVKRTIIKAMATLSWAHYFSDVFDDDEWLELNPVQSVYGLAYFSALKGGYDNVLALSMALDSGLNERIKVESGGLMRAEVRVNLIPNNEGMVGFQSELAKRLVNRTKQQINEEKDKPTE